MSNFNTVTNKKNIMKYISESDIACGKCIDKHIGSICTIDIYVTYIYNI